MKRRFSLRHYALSAALLAGLLATPINSQGPGGGGGYQGGGGFQGGGFQGGGGPPGGFGGQVGGGQGGGAQGAGDNLGQTPPTDAIVQYDPETDAIIVVTDAATNSQIKKVVDALDRPIPQVLIKVLFLEVTHEKDLDLGLDASFSYDATGSTPVSSTQTVNGVAQTVTTNVPNMNTLSTIFGAPTTGGYYKILDKDLQATIHALAGVTKTNVLSRPSIMTRNNQQATITVGQEVPFVDASSVTADGQTNTTIRYNDIGIILEVTPHITQDRLVQMDVSPEISNLDAQSIVISETLSQRIIDLRSADTSVVVADGKTVVIGGLMQDDNNSNIQEVPLLGEIPILGNLFKRTITSKQKTELLIFLTPYVVNTANEVKQMSVEEHNKADLISGDLTPKQKEKYIDNLPGSNPWNAKP